MESFIGPGISAISSLIGGFLNRDAAAEGRNQQMQVAQQSFNMQNEALHHGLQLRAEDAIDAYNRTGIHPLTMLGVNPATPSGVSFNAGDTSAMGNAVASAGQELGRGVSSVMSQRERLASVARMDALNRENMGLQNDLLRVRIAEEAAKLHAPGLPPPMPVRQRYLVDGQGSTAFPDTTHLLMPSALVKDQPLKRIVSAPGAPEQEAGATADISHSRTKTGWAANMSEDVAKRSGIDFINTFIWNIRNRLLPSLGMNMAPPAYAPPNYRWTYNPVKQEYQLVRKGGARGGPHDYAYPEYDERR